MFKEITCLAPLLQILHQFSLYRNEEALREYENFTNLLLYNEILCKGTDFIIFNEVIENVLKEIDLDSYNICDLFYKDGSKKGVFLSDYDNNLKIDNSKKLTIDNLTNCILTLSKYAKQLEDKSILSSLIVISQELKLVNVNDTEGNLDSAISILKKMLE